jgi:hypothetical protein
MGQAGLARGRERLEREGGDLGLRRRRAEDRVSRIARRQRAQGEGDHRDDEHQRDRQARIVGEENERLEQAAASSVSIAEFISDAIRAVAAITRREGRLLRVFNERSIAEPALLERAKTGRAAPRLFTRLLLDRRAEIRHPDPERAADMAFWLFNSALDRRVNTPMWRHWDTGAERDWPLFVDDLVDAVQCFLLTPRNQISPSEGR